MLELTGKILALARPAADGELVRPDARLVAEVRRRLALQGMHATDMEIETSLVAVADQPDLEVHQMRLLDRISGDVLKELWSEPEPQDGGTEPWVEKRPPSLPGQEP